MKNLIHFVFILSIMTLLGSCSEDSDSDNDSDIDANLLIGTWYLTGETENGQNTFDVNACNFILIFNDTQIISSEFFGDSCENEDSFTSNYEINGSDIIENAEGESYTIKILELTPYKLVLEETDGNFVYVETYSNIFGAWTLSGNVSCTSTNGDLFEDNGIETITLNEDYTVSTEEESGGEYVSHDFTFENNVLSITAIYHEFFSPTCGGVDFKNTNYSATYTYDLLTNTFTGTAQSIQEEVSGAGCVEFGSTCNGSTTLTR